MNDLDAFLAMLVSANISHTAGPAIGMGDAVTRVEIFEQNRPWILAAAFNAEGRLLSIGTWIPPDKEWLITGR